MSIGENIKKIRKEKGLTQKELGDLLGVSQAAIGQFENDKSNPKIDTLEKIANVLGVHYYSFFDSPMDVPEVKNTAYAGGLEFIRNCIKDGLFNYEKEKQEQLINEINACIEKGLEIEDKQTYYYNLEVVYSHKIMNDLLLPYSKSDITDIVQLIANFLLLHDYAQDKVIQYEIDLLGNKIYQRSALPEE